MYAECYNLAFVNCSLIYDTILLPAAFLFQFNSVRTIKTNKINSITISVHHQHDQQQRFAAMPTAVQGTQRITSNICFTAYLGGRLTVQVFPPMYHQRLPASSIS